MNTVLLIARLVFGLGLAAHGAQKLFGWFGGGGIAGTRGFVGTMGFRPAALFAPALGLAEFGGGMLTALGLLWPVGPAIMLIPMVVAMIVVHAKNGFFAANNGVELPLMVGTGALLLAFTGPGTVALDALLGWRRYGTAHAAAIATGVAIVIGLLSAAIRRPPPPKPAGSG